MKNSHETKRQLSPEGRANIAAAQKARWAEKKAEKNVAAELHAAVEAAAVATPKSVLSATSPRDLLRTAVESMEFQRDTLTDRIDTLREVLGQM